MITVGVDFGASRLRVAMSRGGRPEMVRHRSAGVRMPVLLDFGEPRPQPGTFRIASLKRALDFEQAVAVPGTQVDSLDYVAAILKEVRDACLQEAGTDGIHCVAAVPPCFSQRQRSSLRLAATNAGFPCVKLVDDTYAALLATDELIRDCRCVLVYSWGASAFSAYLYRRNQGHFAALAQEGDRNLGGDDVDTVLANEMLRSFAASISGILPRGDPNLYHRSAVEAERAKRAWDMSETYRVRIVDLIGPTASSSLQEVSAEIPAQVCQDAMDDAIDRTLLCVQEVLKNGGSSPDALLLAGGMAKLSHVQRALENQLGLEPKIADEEAVARGAVLHGLSVKPEEWKEADSRRFAGKQPTPAHIQGNQVASTDTDKVGATSRPGRIASESWAERFSPSLDEAERQESQGEHEQAIATLETIISDLAGLSGELHRKASARYDSAGDHEKAMALLKAGNARDPGNRFLAVDLARFCHLRATAARSRKRTAEAIKTLDDGISAIRSVRDHVKLCGRLLGQLLHLKGCLLCDEGRLAEAEEAVRECIRLDPTQAVYKEHLEQIKTSLKRSPGQKIKKAILHGRDRNRPCPCGSGKKYKHCCGA